MERLEGDIRQKSMQETSAGHLTENTAQPQGTRRKGIQEASAGHTTGSIEGATAAHWTDVIGIRE